MPSTSERERRFERAELLLTQFLERAEAEIASDDFEAFLAEHAELAAELRELHAACGAVKQGLAQGHELHASEQAQVQAVLEELRASGANPSRYAVEGELGKGGMGAVFRVIDRALGRPLAMKVILGQLEAARSGRTPPVAPRQLRRFLNEARITGQLDHPGIVPVHEVGVDAQGRAFFTMKLVQGRTLAEVFRLQASGDRQWTRARVLSLLQRVCEALAYAHERGVIHRDLKPANVMVGDFGEVYVMDWGLARRIDEGAERVEDGAAADPDPLREEWNRTREGAVVGTPAYMSPEQAAGEIGRMGPRSDVYALGAMLYQMIAGHAPYLEPGRDASSVAVLASIGLGPPKALDTRSAPAELIAIVERAMAREAGQRYPDVRALALDLQAFLERRVVRAYETGPWAEARKWIQRNRALAGAIGTALALLLVGAALYRRMKESEVIAAERRTQDNIRRSQEMFSDAILLAENDDGVAGGPSLGTERRRAIEMLSEALWLNPGLMEARFHIAILEHELGELDSARERLEDLGDFGATNRCVEWLRSSLDSQGKKIAAPEDLSKSATSAEVFYWCRDKQIRLLRMAALARLPDIADNPLYGLPSRFLSAICWGTGRWEGIDAERALRDLEVARALAPQSPIVLENLSAIYLRSFLKRQESDSSITAANSEEVRRARSILEQDLLRALPQPFITRELTWNNYVSTVYSTLEEREAAVSFARERVQTTGLAEPKRWLVRMRLSDVELMEAEGAEVPESLWDEVLPLIDARIQSADATGVDWLLAAWRAHFFGDAELQAEGVRRARELGVRLAFDIDKLEALGRLAAPAGAVPKSGG